VYELALAWLAWCVVQSWRETRRRRRNVMVVMSILVSCNGHPLPGHDLLTADEARQMLEHVLQVPAPTNGDE